MIENVPDTCLVETCQGGNWDLCLPDGKHIVGKEADQKAAREAARQAHDVFALKCWARGRMDRHGNYQCPLN